MSLVTKCPSCYTSFIVKPKQLKSHQGQVRCGQCQHIFVAADYLSEPSTAEGFLNTKKIVIKPKKPFALLVYGLLITLAILQTLYFLRGNIAKQWPVFKPALLETCHYLGCTLPLPQHAELIAIDDAELVKDEAHEDLVKFNCMIVNNAPYTQSFPSIEITLTDKEDKPLVRRKISPKEYLMGKGQRQEEGFAGNDEIHVSLNLKAAGLNVSGFRAFLVY